jgi:hypothetical protein
MLIEKPFQPIHGSFTNAIIWVYYYTQVVCAKGAMQKDIGWVGLLNVCCKMKRSVPRSHLFHKRWVHFMKNRISTMDGLTIFQEKTNFLRLPRFISVIYHHWIGIWRLTESIVGLELRVVDGIGLESGWLEVTGVWSSNQVSIRSRDTRDAIMIDSSLQRARCKAKAEILYGFEVSIMDDD